MKRVLFHQPDNFDCEVTFTNGEKLLLNTSQLQPHRDLWTFPEWQCNAGTELLMITGDMTVYSCNSKNNNMGNLLDPKFKMMHGPVTCTKLECQPKNMDLYCTKSAPREI